MEVAEEAAGRFSALATEGEQIANQSPVPGYRTDVLPHAMFYAWRTRCLTALRVYLPSNHPTITEFDKLVEHPFRNAATNGVGVLHGLAADAADGFLFKQMSNLIAAEVFSDFLEMAKHLVSTKHYHAAASLVGAVLEDSLRRLATHRGVKYSKRDGLDALNKALAQDGAYNAVDQGRIDTWRQVRNDADHGNWNEVRSQDVSDMLKWVTDFVGQQIK